MKIVLIAATAFATLAPAAAFATDICPEVAKDQWMSEAAITEKATGLGYQVRSVEIDDGCLEVYAIDKDGKKVEVYFHPGNGDVVNVKDAD